MKTLFFGTPQIAVPYLEWLIAHTQVVGAVCRPDEPAGRGQEIKAPPVKVFAESKNIPVSQPAGPWPKEFSDKLKALGADLGIVVAYGRILPPEVFEAPRLGCVNIHFSLLPKYRGAAPMQWALIHGESVTGVSAFALEKGLDAGPLIHQKELFIEPSDNTVTLREKLVPLGVSVLERVVDDAKKGSLNKAPQSGAVVPAPPLKKEDGHIHWDRPARDIINRVRGVVEWPGAFTHVAVNGEKRLLKILRTAATKDDSPSRKPAGTILAADKEKGILVAAQDAGIFLTEVQPEGKKPMSAWAFWQGARLSIGDKFGN